jgi:L-alanine-DL-glutamate epimerase-like enolase superfamily enzyme
VAQFLVPQGVDGHRPGWLVGWSEYNESYGSKGLSAVIDRLAEGLIGEDPRPIEKLSSRLYASTRQAPGGVNQQAIGAIENALLDVKAKALGVPVYELFGGPVRDLYWSHCGSYRLHYHEIIGQPPLKDLEGIKALGAHVAAQGFTALKCNIFLFDDDQPTLYFPGFGAGAGGPELNPNRRIIRALDEQLGQSIQHIVGSQMPGDVDRQALPGVLVDDRQHVGRLTVVCASHDEVVGPDVVRPSRPETDAGPVVEP